MARTFSRYIVASIIVAVACSLTLVGGGGSQGTASLRAVSAAGVGDPVATSIPEPLNIASDKVMAYIAIPDLAATVERIETVGAAFAPPGEFQPGMLKMQVGMMLGDPDLTHLDGAMPLVIMVFKTDTPTEPPTVAGFMSHAEGSPYGEALTAMGMQFNVKDGVLTLAKTPEALAVAGEAVSAYRKIAAAGIKSNLRVTLHIGRLMETYGTLVQAQVDQMAGMIPLISPMGEGSATPNQGAQLGKVLKLETNAIFALLDQIEVIQYDVNLSADAIGVDEIFKAKPGTAMADLLSGGPAGKNRALALLSEPGV
ncbi:MAG: hypothetical protein KAJ01_01195, partial [Candidatus Hydrogenedentes bacterium]|nr:hypothetical protein [Candidatus Hydrogenedentota bacterium]